MKTLSSIYYIFVIAALFLLYGCNPAEEVCLFQPASIEEIFVSPGPYITVGKEGGTVMITAYYREHLEDGSENKRVLNDELIETTNFNAPYVHFIGRERIDHRTVRYIFEFEANTTGEERGRVSAAISDTTSRPYGFGWFSITQLSK